MSLRQRRRSLLREAEGGGAFHEKPEARTRSSPRASLPIRVGDGGRGSRLTGLTLNLKPIGCQRREKRSARVRACPNACESHSKRLLRVGIGREARQAGEREGWK